MLALGPIEARPDLGISNDEPGVLDEVHELIRRPVAPEAALQLAQNGHPLGLEVDQRAGTLVVGFFASERLEAFPHAVTTAYSTGPCISRPTSR